MPGRRRRTRDFVQNNGQYSTNNDGVSLTPTLNRFAEDTSMLGFRYLHTQYKTWFRIVWAVVIIFFLGLTIYQVVERIGYYFVRNPLNTQKLYDTPSRITFPTILLALKVKTSNTGIIRRKFCRASRVAYHSPDLLRTMALMYNEDGSPSLNRSLVNSIASFSEVDFSYVFRSSLQTVDDFILSCHYGRGQSCMDEIRPVITPNGLCFAVSSNITVKRPGPETTLSLLLNLETYEIIPGWIGEPGVVMSMYDNKVPHTAYSGEGMHLAAGKVVTVPINDIRQLILQLHRHNSKCGRISVGNYAEKDYSRTFCQWYVTYEKIAKHCGCIPNQSPKIMELILQTKKAFENEMEVDAREKCPEDCNEITYTTIVFGSNLDSNEITSYLPSDWDDVKEKRLNDFQRVFGIIPNYRIPLIRSIQDQAYEAQHFLNKISRLLNIAERTKDLILPCLRDESNYNITETIKKFHASEPLWTSFIEFVFPFHIGSVLSLLKIEMDQDSVMKVVDQSKMERRDIRNKANCLYKATENIDLMILGVNESSNIFGFQLLENTTKMALKKRLIELLTNLKDCLLAAALQSSEMLNNSSDILQSTCGQKLSDDYEALRVGLRIPKVLSMETFNGYADTVQKLTEAIWDLKWNRKPRIFQWRNHGIDLKLFRALYMYVFCKRVNVSRHLWSIFLIKETIMQLESALEARAKFLDTLHLQPTAIDAISLIRNSILCLQNLSNSFDALKNDHFLRTEWTSKLQRLLTVANSYSVGKHYDEVNLLFVKIYFAHFKREMITQERSYSLFLLLAEIGGTIGLYVGASLLTIAETAVFFIERKTRKGHSKGQRMKHLV
uniref:Amiloride-sensitive cation channel 5 n=1 Tax=Syphacia muris TaxID=451379 RepID=A0A0N5AE45_9BILA